MDRIPQSSDKTSDAEVVAKLQNLVEEVVAAPPIPVDLNSVIWDLGVVARGIRQVWLTPISPGMRREKFDAIANHVEHLAAQLQLFPVRDKKPGEP